MHEKLEWTKAWKDMVRIGIIIGFICGFIIGALITIQIGGL